MSACYPALRKSLVLAVLTAAWCHAAQLTDGEALNCNRLLELRCGDATSYKFLVKVGADWKIAEVRPEALSARTEMVAKCMMQHPGSLDSLIAKLRRHGGEAPFELSWMISPPICDVP